MRKITVFFISFIATFITFTGMNPIASAQCGFEWSLGTGSGPGAYEICYDEARSQTVLFSGSDQKTYVWNGRIWSVAATGGPPTRGAGAMVYDSVGQRCLLFGGYSDAGVRKDLWQWNGTAWSQLSAGPADASGRGDFAMSFDRDRNRLVIHGGYQGSGGSLLADTLEWNPTTNTWARWATGPIGNRYAHRMAYDELRHETVLHGGFNFTNKNDTWKWNGSTWTAAGTTGPARYVFGMTFDSQRGQIILHGGTTCCGEVEYPQTYVWNGTSWSLCALQGPARGYMNIAYDRVRDTIILPGGMGPSPSGRAYIPETWELAMSEQPSTLNVPGKFATIQAAVDAAENGDTVQVAPGNYSESVNLRGKAILVRSAVPGSANVVAPQGTRSFVATSNESVNTKVIGFKITMGGKVGGGIETVNSAPTFDSCIIEGCKNGHGGGAQISGGATSFIACDFVDCVASGTPATTYGGGGAIRCIGGATTVDYCSFRGCLNGQANILMQEGGGTALIKRSTFLGVETEGSPWGNIYNAYSTVTIEDSIFDSMNSAALFGWSPFTVRRCDFRNFFGSRVMEMRLGQTLIDDCSFEHCETSGPLFGVIYSGTYAIGSSRFCSVSNPLFQGPWTNLGGNDFNAACSCFGDLTGDGKVNGGDLSYIFAGWGYGPGQAIGDLSGDGDIDAVDIALLIANWGDCPN